MTHDNYTNERQSPALSVEVKDLDSDLRVYDCAVSVHVQITLWSKPHLKFVTLVDVTLDILRNCSNLYSFFPVSLKINYEGKEFNLIFRNL